MSLTRQERISFYVVLPILTSSTFSNTEDLKSFGVETAAQQPGRGECKLFNDQWSFYQAEEVRLSSEIHYIL